MHMVRSGGYLLPMATETIPHLTSVKAGEILGVKPSDIAALAADGTLDAVVIHGVLRVSQLSVERLWFEQGQARLREQGIR